MPLSLFVLAGGGSAQDVDGVLRQARLSVEQGRFADAVALLEPACKQPAADDQCRWDLALAYYKAGRLAEARDVAGRLAEQNKDPEVFKLLAAIAEDEGRHEDAARELHRAAEAAPTEQNIFDLSSFLIEYQANQAASEMLEYGIKRYPQSARLRVALGIVLYATSRYQEAVEALCQAVDLDPTDPRPMEFLGKLLDVSPEMAEDVRSRLRHFVDLYPDNARARYYYALSLWQSASATPAAPLNDVQSLLEQAITLDPGLTEARYQLGLLYERREQWERAIATYNALATAQPDFERAYYRLGQLYMRQGSKDEAQKAFHRYRSLRKATPSEFEPSLPTPKSPSNGTKQR